MDTIHANACSRKFRRTLDALKLLALEALALMPRAIKRHAMAAVTVCHLEMLLAVHAHSFEAFIARLCIGCHLFALLARLLPEERLLQGLYSRNHCLSQGLLGIGEGLKSFCYNTELP
jgi:hypothetical protein